MNTADACLLSSVQEYEAEHGPTPIDDVEMTENGIGGKSGGSSGTGTPRGIDSGSVSPTTDINNSSSTSIPMADTKSLETTGTGS